MENVSTVNLTTLFYGAIAHVDSGQRTDKRYVLMPVFVYRVVIPEIKKTTLNFLEKAILGLYSINITDYKEIADELNINHELVVFIVNSLIEKNFINKYEYIITEQGRAILEKESFVNSKLITGYIFQDAWTGEVYPSFQTELKYVETQIGKKGLYQLVLGLTGKPRIKDTHLKLPPNMSRLENPTKESILKAISRHRKLQKQKTRLSSFDILDIDEQTLWEGGEIQELSQYLSQIEFIEEQPTLMLLSTFLYGYCQEWYIADPFGNGISPFLYKILESRLDNHLKNIIEQDILPKDDEIYKEPREKAKKIIEMKLTAVICQKEELFSLLLEVQIAYLRAESTRQKADIDDTLVRTRKCLEALLGSFRCNSEIWKRIPKKADDYYQEIAKLIGFKEHDIKPAPNSVKEVFEKPDKGFKLHAMVIAILLLAVEAKETGNSHILCKIAEENPDFLIELNKLINICHDAAHANGEKISFEDFQNAITNLYETTRLLLDIY